MVEFTNVRSRYPWQDDYLDEEFDTIIEALSFKGERVIDIVQTPNGIRLTTGPSRDSGRTLSKDRLDRFIRELMALSERLEGSEASGNSQ
ncbi:MAG: hypothetical protein AAGL89_09660 [Pseudomonadota bacterium]